MEKVEIFEINLDLTDREVIYDYAAKEEIHRPPSGKWDESMFKGKGSLKAVPKENENELMRIKLMDNALMDTRFLEKKVKVSEDQEGAAAAAVEFDDVLFGMGEDDAGTYLPRRLLPVYKPGEQMKGYVVLSLKEPMAAANMRLNFVGQVKMNVRIYHKHGYYDDTRYDTFHEEEHVLWEKASGKECSEMSDTFNLLSLNDGPAQSREIPAGKHKFYFEFVLPQNAPQSVPPMYISTVNYAHLIWRLKAKIDTETFANRKNVATHQGLLVEDILDIAQKPENLQPISAEEQLDTGLLWSSGVIICRATVATAGHVKGTPVPVTVEISNNSGGDVNKVEAFVRLGGVARLSESKLSLRLKINFKSTKVSEGHIKSGEYRTFHWTLPWDFTESSGDGRMFPVGHLEESKMLDFKYEVVVKVQRKGLHRNLELSVPLEVGNYNSSAMGEGREEYGAPPLYPSLT